jgi:two-component system, cell cycle response regulator DivK
MKYVLVAEDDDFNFLVIETLLSSENYLVFRAKNGEEAVHYFKTHNDISLILMDIQMPVMDGLTATEEIRKLNKNIPIVIQTSFAPDIVKEKAFESGCTDFITKPFSADKLIPKVKEYVC